MVEIMLTMELDTSFAVLLLFCFSCAGATNYPITATAALFTPIDGSEGQQTLQYRGFVNFSQAEKDRDVMISGRLANLVPGKHGFHVHALGNIVQNCVASGTHYNPFGKKHGDVRGDERHIGDLGNVEANAQGIADFNYPIPAANFPLIGKESIVGRTIVVHLNEDDLGKGAGDRQAESQKTGNAGARIACGVIGYGSDFAVAKASSIAPGATILQALAGLLTFLTLRAAVWK